MTIALTPRPLPGTGVLGPHGALMGTYPAIRDEYDIE